MLEIKRENLPKSKIKLTIKVPSAKMRQFFQKTYEKLAPTVEVKGFRKGKAPAKLTVSAIGENRFMQEILDLALQETYGEALKQEKIMPVAMPQINVKMMKDLLTDQAELEYEAEIDCLPEVEVGNYKIYLKKVKLPKRDIEVKDEEVEQVIGHLRRQHATFEEKTGAAEIGDRVEMDFEGSERGVVLDNFTSKNYPAILGAKTLLPEFEKQIVGMKKESNKEFDLELKQTTSRETEKALPKTKKVHFNVHIHDVKKVNLPEMNDELAKKFQKNNIDELKKAILVDVSREKEMNTKREKENVVLEELLKNTKIEIPPSLIENEVHRILDDLRSRAQMIGLTFEQYLAQVKKTEADLHEELKPDAEKTVKIGLILGEIAKLEKMDLKNEQLGHKVMNKLLEIIEKK